MKKYDFGPVHIRTKKLSNGKESIYLDIHKDGERVKEYLRLYLVPESNRACKLANKETMKLAEEIKAKRIVEIQNDKFQLHDKAASKLVLVEWMEEQRKYYKAHGNNNYSKTIHNLIVHLNKFAPNTQLRGVTPSLLRRFLDYLTSDGTNKYGGKLSDETVYTYFTVFSILMNKAVRLDMITSNPFHKLSQSEKPQRRTKKKEYLTLEEVQKLADTPCDDWRVKHAFLFCCFTGLRYIDVSRL